MIQFSLDEFMVKRGGSVDPSRFVDETFELFSIPAFDTGIPEIVEGRNIGSSKKCIEPNDILLSKIVPHIRRCCVVPPKGKYRQIASGEWIQFRSDQLYSQYLKFFLISDTFHWQFMHTVSGVGGSLMRASSSLVAKIKVPVPPIEEQQKIASILDAADNLRQKDQQLIEKYTALSQSLFLEMFGDPETNPMGWKKKPINNVCTDIVDCVNRTASVVDYETEYKMIRTTNVKNYTVDISTTRYVTKDTYEKWIRRLTPQKGDIIFTREAPVGEAGILETNDYVFLGQRTMEYRVNRLLANPYYLLYELMGSNVKRQIQKLSTGSTVKHLSGT